MRCDGAMKCEDVRKRLDDYVDSLLDDGTCARIEEHLATCAECRSELEGLDALWERTKSLPRHMMPARDLWGGIEVRLAGARLERVVEKRSWLARRWAIGMAAAAVVAMGVLGLLGGFSREVIAPEVEPPATVDAGLAKEIRDADAEYAIARQGVLESLAECGDSLSPETRQVIEQNLAVIDGAVAGIRARLAEEPGNARLLRMLVMVQQQGLDVVRLAIRLSPQT